jgi:hypothetical protein
MSVHNRRIDPIPRTGRASSSGVDSPGDRAFPASYSPHPWGSPSGPAFGCSKSLPAILSVRRLAHLRSGFLQTSPHGAALAVGESLLSTFWTQVLLQGTFTPLVHAHAGRTPADQADFRRSLAPHQYMPMPGVHKALHWTAIKLRSTAAGYAGR